MLLTQQHWVRFPGSQMKNNNVTEVNQQRWLEESGQWLENVDRTHLVQTHQKSTWQNGCQRLLT